MNSSSSSDSRAPAAVRLRVNGEETRLPAGTTVAVLIESLGLVAGRVACERNMTILRRQDFPDTVLADGDNIEIVQMIGGG